MGFLSPIALGLAALAGPIILLYMLKRRRQPITVSSLMLWERVLADREANAPWQRLKRNLLLLLQLLILALLVMALARPYLSVEARVPGNAVILLDGSASMQATDVLPSRFEQAKQTATEIINQLASDKAITVINVGRTPQVLAAATSNRTVLNQAIAGATPAASAVDWPAALTLAAATASSLPDATVVILSDGAAERAFAADSLPVIDAPMQFIPIGEGRNNQGITALSVRDGQAGPELFVQLFNSDLQSRPRLVEIWLDGNLFTARQMTLPAQETVTLTIDGLPETTSQIEARLTEADILAVDDRAWAVRNPSPTRILVVGPGNLFLERALELLPDLSLERASPDQPLPESPFDLIIFDRTAPPDPPPTANLLLIAPPAETVLLDVRGSFSQTRITQSVPDHPLLSYLSLDRVNIAEARALTPPAWAVSLVQAGPHPLLLAGEQDGQRVAVIAFDLFKSDWPLQIEFPVFMNNAVDWLVPNRRLSQSRSYQAGDSLPLPTNVAVNELVMRPPSAGPIAIENTETSRWFNQTSALGIYQLWAADERHTQFAVNLLTEQESHLAPRQFEIVGGTANDVAEQTVIGRQEAWWWLVIAGLGVMLLEWWWYWRGEGQ